MADDLRKRPAGRRQADVILAGRLNALERGQATMNQRMEAFEVHHKEEYAALRVAVQANTTITQQTLTLLEPYLANIRSIDKFTNALEVIGDGLIWFARKCAKWLKPIGIVCGAVAGAMAVTRAWRTGTISELFAALAALF